MRKIKSCCISTRPHMGCGRPRTSAWCMVSRFNQLTKKLIFRIRAGTWFLSLQFTKNWTSGFDLKYGFSFASIDQKLDQVYMYAKICGRRSIAQPRYRACVRTVPWCVTAAQIWTGHRGNVRATSALGPTLWIGETEGNITHISRMPDILADGLDTTMRQPSCQKGDWSSYWGRGWGSAMQQRSQRLWSPPP
eukprot:COSAG01_NODE_899_length_12871_cov_27.629572_3_plen_192_part_00